MIKIISSAPQLTLCLLALRLRDELVDDILPIYIGITLRLLN